MKPQLLKRRELLWRLAQSTLGLSILGRASQVLATAAEKPAKSILVLGAGLSGLYSALLLEAQGFEVTIWEARKRVGGRVFTLDDLPGKPEAGGQSFNEQYSRLLSLAQQLDVPVKTPQKPNSELLLYINELAVLPSGWANGVNADKLAALNPQQLERTVISQLAKMRPATKGNIKISRVVTWGADPFSLGAYAHFAPGQIREFKSQMTKPWHRIYFAGEHTATFSIK